ncbi:MAG: Rrf2 family transcriptional regulator [Chlamydiae bacterium]|nr:Rrf2 family transcriptional regulator [Chlamydiota bacterium]
MKLITKKTDYAIKALCHMAKTDGIGLFTASKLSKELKIPKPLLRSLLQQLGKNSIISSSKGNLGGFKLNKPANKIFIIDLIKIFQGPIELSLCFVKKHLCFDINHCPLRKVINGIASDINKKLAKVTIASLNKNL